MTPEQHIHAANQLSNAATLIYAPRAFAAITRAIQEHHRAQFPLMTDGEYNYWLKFNREFDKYIQQFNPAL